MTIIELRDRLSSVLAEHGDLPVVSSVMYEAGWSEKTTLKVEDFSQPRWANARVPKLEKCLIIEGD